jgi:hypothetical protein
VVVQVLEGESLDPLECSAIGRTVIRDLPPNLPKGWPVEVTYEYGVNGRLSVRAKVRGTNKEVHLELERDESMSTDRLARWKNVLAGGGGLDAFDLAIQSELEDLKRQATARGGAQPAAAPRPVQQQPTQHQPLQPRPASTQPQMQPTVQPTVQPRMQPVATPQVVGRPAPSGAPGSVPAAEFKPMPQPVSQPGPVPSGPARSPAPQPQTPAFQTALSNNVAFTCPHCRQVSQVSSTLAGRQANCPRCGGAIIVPG